MVKAQEWAATLNDRESIYPQIIERFRRGIVGGEMQPGERIPSIRELAIAMRVNPNTVHRAYQEMEREGLIYSQRGMGYFVIEDTGGMKKVKKELVKQAVEKFLQEMRALGLEEDELMQEIWHGLRGEEGQNDG